MDTPAEEKVDHVVGTQEPSQVWPKFENLPANEDAVVKDAPVEKLDARGLGIRVTNCGACDGCHDDLKVNEYARPLGPFTHWYMCPTLHDPVNLTLGMMKLGEALEFNGAIVQTLAKAQIAGRYMAVICYIDPANNNALMLTRHGNKFPTEDVYPTKGHEGFVGLLLRNLKEEFGEPQPVEMKKVEPSPLKSLMGRAVEATLGDKISEAMHPLPPQ